MKFDVSNYPSSSVVMHVSTEEEAKIFCDYLHSLGRKWSSGDSYKEETNFYNYEGKTCYSLKGTFCSIEYYQNLNYEILEFKDFEWNDEKKEGNEERKVLLSDIEISLSNVEGEIYMLQKHFEEATELFQRLKEELK